MKSRKWSREKIKGRVVARQEESRRFVSKNEKEELHWHRGGWVSCCVQWRYLGWKAQEKMAHYWWNWNPQEKMRCSRKGRSKFENWKRN